MKTLDKVEKYVVVESLLIEEKQDIINLHNICVYIFTENDLKVILNKMKLCTLEALNMIFDENDMELV